MSRQTASNGPPDSATVLLYHFCRLQLPQVVRAATELRRHLVRTFELSRAKSDGAMLWPAYLENLYPLDWFVACSCLDGDRAAWDYLFAARANRSDCLLVDALRARAIRLYPRDEERQITSVTEFWSHLLVADTPDSLPVLARYDGLRPLVPWLIRVFQNYHISQLRHRAGTQALPEDDLAMPLPESADQPWHEAFCLAARAFLGTLTDQETLILGLRLRYHLSQREVAHMLNVHEGTISRQTNALRDRCLEAISRRLTAEGWAGDNLLDLILKEMGGLLLDEPRLSADRLAALLAGRGKTLPPKDVG